MPILLIALQVRKTRGKVEEEKCRVGGTERDREAAQTSPEGLKLVFEVTV